MHLPITLDRTLAEPLQNQLYEQLRTLIITQRLKPNSRLIATRFLAEQLGISRTTVLLAYERLISEGYVETRPAVGTFVCEVLPDQPPAAPAAPSGVEFLPQAELRPPVFRGRPPAAAGDQRAILDFWSGPDFRAFPLKTWQRITQHVLECHGRGMIEQPPATGVHALKTAISDWLAAHRGIVADPEQVIIVGGRQQAYDIAARLFLRPGDRVVVESPGNEAASWLFESAGAAAHVVPVDEHGMVVDALPDLPVSLAYVTPSHQQPIGGTLPIERRERLVEWARAVGAYIIEDDCNGDFRYRGMGPPALKSIDPYGLVLFTGSFSQSLGAGLRLAYLVVPAELAEPAKAVKALLDCGSPWLEQTVLAEFIVSGEYDRHLRRVRKIYMERRDSLVEALHRHFGEVHLTGSDAGMHLTWFLPRDYPNAPVIQDLARHRGVGVYTVQGVSPADPAGAHYAERALLLGFSALEEHQIRDGIAALAGVVHDYFRKAAG